jgi:hypothetical protein
MQTFWIACDAFCVCSYVSVCVHLFVSMLIDLFGGAARMVDTLSKSRIHFDVPPVFCCCCCLPTVAFNGLVREASLRLKVNTECIIYVALKRRSRDATEV